jgi:ABC-type enterochelin transport system permease subunit
MEMHTHSAAILACSSLSFNYHENQKSYEQSVLGIKSVSFFFTTSTANIFCSNNYLMKHMWVKFLMCTETHLYFQACEVSVIVVQFHPKLELAEEL